MCYKGGNYSKNNELRRFEMVGILAVTLVGVPVAIMTVQYRNYRERHPKGFEKACDCKN